MIRVHTLTEETGDDATLNVYPQESTRAMSVGEKYSEYTPWGFNGAYYYARIRYLRLGRLGPMDTYLARAR